MSRNAKVLLTLSIICLLAGAALNTGLINPRGLDALYIILPLGAVFFGLFLIALTLQREGGDTQEDEHRSEPSSHEPTRHAPPEHGG